MADAFTQPTRSSCKPPPAVYNVDVRRNGGGDCALRIVLFCTCIASSASEAPATGNFGISSDCWFSNIVYNPSAYSTYLAEAGRGATLEVSVDGSPPRPLSAIFSASPPSVFPECSFSATLSPGVQLRWRAFAPLSPEDAELGFIPLLLGGLTLDVSPTAPRYSRNATLLYRYFCGSDEGARAACSVGGSAAWYAWLPQPLQGAANFSAGPLFVGATGGLAAGAHCGGLPSDRAPALCAQLTVVSEPGGGSSFESGVLFVGYHVPEGRYASAFPTPLSLAVYGASSASLLAAHHAAFVAAIPSTGSPAVDAGMRAWLQAPILLTKGVGTRALTMGYVELNARDSFWTTAGLHALLWPSLEALMLRESCEFACSPGGGPPSYCRAADHGKIPTCVLPTIVRDDNVDITAFWALRVGRYFAATGDAATLEELYPCLRAALLYLQRRAAPGEALPAARADSYWGSWLDVPFMKGRKLIADNSAVYLAAQRVGATAAALLLASHGGAATNATRADVLNFSAAYAAGWRQLTAASASEGGGGGQWDVASGSLRDTRWDGRASNYSLGDQFMAVYFNLLGAPRAQSLLAWVTKPGASGLEGPFGIRALFPYEPHAADPWGGEYDAGVYANGGSYAWLTCGTVLALAAAGDTAGAWRVWLKLTTRMFEPGAGGLAYEYLHSDTGARMGHAPQGWDGVCAAWAWQGGAVRWWRESPVADVGPRGGATGAADPSEVDLGPLPAAAVAAGASAPQPHTYHLVLPQQLGSGSGEQSARLPLLLPLLSVPSRRCFLRCDVKRASAETGQRWDASSAACDVVSGIMPAAGAGGGDSVAWRDVYPCVRQASGFRCDVSGPTLPETATVLILLS